MTDPAEKPARPTPVEFLYLLHCFTRIDADLRELRGEMHRLEAKIDKLRR